MKRAVLCRHIAGPLALLGVTSFATGARAQDDGEPASSESSASSGSDATDSSSDTSASETDSSKHGDDTPSASEDDTDTPSKSAAVAVDVALTPSSDRTFTRLWIGVAGSLDLAIVSGVKDTCLLNAGFKPASSAGTYCTNPGGTDFPDRSTLAQNAALVPGQSGILGGGIKIGDVRALLAADYALTPYLLAGVRLGYVLNTYPGHAAVSGRPDFIRNLHLEARGTYLFGKDALRRVAFTPMAFGGAGIATTDAHSRTSVSLTGVRGKTPVDSWQVAGPGLLVLGGGMRYGFSSRAAFSAAWKLELAFGNATPLFAMGPELAFQYGF